MLMVSSLLGSVKPPVASAHDIAAADGVFQALDSTHDIHAVDASGHYQFRLPYSEKCLICLEQYHDKESIRRLAKCSHTFHKNCIDEVCKFLILKKVDLLITHDLQWLTTGRNSCPLCRRQGVEERTRSPEDGQPMR